MSWGYSLRTNFTSIFTSIFTSMLIGESRNSSCASSCFSMFFTISHDFVGFTWYPNFTPSCLKASHHIRRLLRVPAPVASSANHTCDTDGMVLRRLIRIAQLLQSMRSCQVGLNSIHFKTLKQQKLFWQFCSYLKNKWIFSNSVKSGWN